MACYDGRRLSSRNFLVFVRRRPDDGPWRLGLAVTRKVGTAVRRSRIKRVLREFFRLNQYRLPGATDIVVVPKRGLDAGQVDLSMVAAELQPLLPRLKAAPAPGGRG